MRWTPYFLLGYFALATQVALSGYVDWRSASPNLVLGAAIFIAINAQRDEALIAAFLLGLCHDLFTQQPFGLHAFSYGLVGLFVVAAQPAVYRDHPLTHFSLTLAAALMCGGIGWACEWLYPLIHRSAPPTRSAVLSVLGSAVYTAAAAVIVIGALTRMKRLFGFKAARQYSVARA